ncbi:MAG TPA: cytochrome c biogenesis protein CcsA [Candidatus Dormibacteraeota bacterium]|nr:cytochrome c biogenesis protein CcsA [Candidatus Dormibacteraeota bacterium]
MDWSLTLLRIALAFYCLGFINSFLPILGRVRTQRFTPWLAGAGWVAHTLALVALGAALKRCPLGTVPEVLSALAWSTVLVYLVVFWRHRIEVLHVVILPLVLVLLFVSDLLPQDVIPLTATLRPSLRRLHVTVIIFAMAALSITFAASVAYVLLDRALKSKRPGRFFVKLPSLESCDKVGQVSLLWAFPLMTLGIVTGAMYSASIKRTYWAWQPQETLAVIAWVILAVVVVARLGWGWRGRNAALLTMVAFSVVLVRILGFY